MRLPKFGPPTWWRSPYSDLVMIGAMALNIYTGLTAETAWWSAISWFCVGLMFGTLIANRHLTRYQHLVQRMQELLEQQQEMIEHIGQAKADEVGRQIAAHLNSLGAEIIPRPSSTPTRH